MNTLCILSFLFWTSFKPTESGQCPASTPNPRDVNVCSAADIANVSIVHLKHTSLDESKPCFCDIKVHKPTYFSFNYYIIDFSSCGIQINIENNIFSCKTGPVLLTLNESTRMTYTYGTYRDWCMVVKIEQPADIDARFSIICNSDIVTSMPSLPPSTSNVVPESTSPSSDTNTTYVKSTSYPSSTLPITDATAANSTVSSAFHQTTDSTGKRQSSYYNTSGTTPFITNWTSSESQPRKALTDIHIVIIAVGSGCLLLAAITVSAICCFVRRRAKGTHSYENNALVDTTNLHSTRDYRNITNQKSCDLEVINQMYVPADAMDFDPTNPSETSTDNRYADVSEITVHRNPETDKHVVNSVAKESDQGVNSNADIHESGISETDVDPQYSVVQKNRDTDSKAKKVSFSDNNQNLPAIPVERNGTDNIYAQVNKSLINGSNLFLILLSSFIILWVVIIIYFLNVILNVKVPVA